MRGISCGNSGRGGAQRRARSESRAASPGLLTPRVLPAAQEEASTGGQPAGPLGFRLGPDFFLWEEGDFGFVLEWEMGSAQNSRSLDKLGSAGTFYTEVPCSSGPFLATSRALKGC